MITSILQSKKLDYYTNTSSFSTITSDYIM